jgi:hypothetical protein
VPVEERELCAYQDHGQSVALCSRTLTDQGRLENQVPKSVTASRVFVESDSRAKNGDVTPATHTATLDTSASSKIFDTYSVSLSGDSRIGSGTFNVAAVIGNKMVSDWSFFDACGSYKTADSS